MTNNFHPLLDNYSKGKISTINFEMDLDKISLAISTNNTNTPTEIIFEDVKAFYYIDHDMPTELTLTDENLNTISYDTYGFGEFSAVNAHTEDELFVSIPNFAVNIKDSSLFIDAHKIRIDNQEFRVR
ncbi:MAG TPA: hypothetical protein DCS67_08625 [Clostridiales bacterium UBA8960]|jgi:hypothetical protein|nr:hypothetical protein [Clostridiales bacterium UBA8960]